MRLVSDIIEMTDLMNIKGYIVTADIQKAFDSLDHDFLLATLEKFNFGKNFIEWIKIIITDQESCVLTVFLPPAISPFKEDAVKEIQYLHIFLSLHLRYCLKLLGLMKISKVFPF